MTVGIQGLTAQPLAKALGLLAKDEAIDRNLEAPVNSVEILPDSS